jgi:hypothetical protein
MLLALIEEADSPESEMVSHVFRCLLDQVLDQNKPLWYGESLPNNCFVVLNAIRAAKLIGSDLVDGIWCACRDRLKLLAKKRMAFYSSNSPKLITLPPLALPELLPYIRTLILAASADDFRQQSALRFSSAYERVLKMLEANALEKHERTVLLAEAVREVVADSIVLESHFDPLGGGLSGSDVYLAAINVKQPFTVSGQTLVFKVAEGAKHGKEIRNFESICDAGLRFLFASVLSKPATIKVKDEYPNILLYEHLAGFVTLRQVLQDQTSEATKLKIVESVCKKLSSALYSHPAETLRTSTVWTGVIDKVVQVSSHLSLSKHPLFSARIARLHEQTLLFLRSLSNIVDGDFRKSMMHGDLNCRNVMVKILAPEEVEVKLIDYETLDLAGDFLVDVGELVEDSVLSCSYIRDAGFVENIVLGELLRNATWIKEERMSRERLILAQLRSLLLIIKHQLLNERAGSDHLIHKAINRWAKLLSQDGESI